MIGNEKELEQLSVAIERSVSYLTSSIVLLYGQQSSGKCSFSFLFSLFSFYFSVFCSKKDVLFYYN